MCACDCLYERVCACLSGIADMGPFGESQSKQVRVMLGVLSLQC